MKLKKSDGSTFNSECVNTNPPQALYHIVGPNKEFIISGSHTIKAVVAPSMNSLQGNANGSKIIDFGNGNKFECEYH